MDQRKNLQVLNTITFCFFLFFFFLPQKIYPQGINQIEVKTSKGSNFIPAYEREGMVYFSIKDFADVISVNYYYDAETGKIELKFDDYSLKFTEKNPFIILIEKNAEPEIFQLPTSVYLINNDLFIPAEYSVSLLQKAYGGEIKFETSVNQARLVVKERKETEIPAPTVIGIPDEKLKDLDYSGAGITGISLEEKANGTLVRVNSEKKIKTYKSTFINGVLTIIFRNVTADIEKIKNASPAGLIKEIKARNINGDTEFQFKVEKDYATNEVISAGTGNDLLITIYSSAFSKKDSDPDKFNGRSKWDFNVIVIDPGHGGKDYGAIGINGVKEKDVNLGIALKLGEMIKKNIKDLKVIYTRSSDSFVELYRRGQIANEKDGKLFISIHCNSTPKKNPDANGFEIYLLRPGRTQEAIQIAERENSVIEFEENPERYQKLTDENFILVSMAQSSYMRYSEKFSGILNDAFSKDLSLSSRGVKQAGFYVLVGASMPGVLIESGFLSNKEDAAFLKSDKGQEQIAESIFDAVKKYKGDYEAVVKSGL